jgi:hypothetical protein
VEHPSAARAEVAVEPVELLMQVERRAIRVVEPGALRMAAPPERVEHRWAALAAKSDRMPAQWWTPGWTLTRAAMPLPTPTTLVASDARSSVYL